MANIIKVQNNADGNQIRNALRAVNTQLGSEVVTDIHKICNTRYNHPMYASGSQLHTAFKQLNTHFGSDVIDLTTIQNVADGAQLQAAFAAIDSSIAILRPELVINGDFSNGDTGWVGMNVVNGVANTIDTTGTQVINTEASKEYALHFTADAKGVVPQLGIQDGNVTPSPVIITVGPAGTGMKPYSTTFTALGPECIIVLSNGSNTSLWDNISIKEVL